MTQQAHHILIVSDDLKGLSSLRKDFESAGFIVSTAVHSAEAFDFFANHAKEINIVLSKIVMRGGDGFGLLNLIRSRDIEIPFVLFSQGPVTLTPEDFFDRGATDFILQAENTKDIISCISNTIGFKHKRNKVRVNASYSLDLKFQSIQKSFTSKMINLGIGGMFVFLDKNFPQTGDLLDFSFQFEEGNIKNIQGSGVVRWVRNQLQNSQAPGVGIEFTHLDSTSEKILKELIVAIQTKSYIPKS